MFSKHQRWRMFSILLSRQVTLMTEKCHTVDLFSSSNVASSRSHTGILVETNEIMSIKYQRSRMRGCSHVYWAVRLLHLAGTKRFMAVHSVDLFCGGTIAWDLGFGLWDCHGRAYAAFEQTLEQCPYCQRRFLPKPFKTHQKACTALTPAKPAGTGLIKYSLTNRLVPGAIAGSMHGKASGYCSPHLHSAINHAINRCLCQPTIAYQLATYLQTVWNKSCPRLCVDATHRVQARLASTPEILTPPVQGTSITIEKSYLFAHNSTCLHVLIGEILTPPVWYLELLLKSR